MTEQQANSTQENLVNRAREALDAGGVEAVVATLKSTENPKRAAGTFNDLLQNLYMTRKDVTGMIAVAEAGVAFCLDHVKQAQSPEDAKDLKQIAKMVTFNAGANCWPGWGDEGVEIAPAHIRAGLKLAEINRDLARELKLGPEPEANGTWLIGALKLATGEPAAALADFQEAKRLAESGGKTDLALMATGYCALARKAEPATATDGAKELELALTRLREHGSQEAKFFAEQIVTADKILLAK